MSSTPQVQVHHSQVGQHGNGRFHGLRMTVIIDKLSYQGGPKSKVTPSTSGKADVKLSPALSGKAARRTISGPIIGFLSALAQDLSFLEPVFVKHGVGDDATLRGMLRMSNWHSWIYGWVKEGGLTELQFRMIVNGLEERFKVDQEAS